MTSLEAISFFDAGIRGSNPGGHAACAAIIHFLSNGSSAYDAKDLGCHPENTNNTAEAEGLILALQLALGHGVTHLSIRSDSKLVVEHALGNWRIKDPALKILHAQAAELASRFASVKISHVRRGKNKEADALVTKFLDELTGIKRSSS